MAKVVLQNLARPRTASSSAVHNLSFECADREFTVLLSPSDGSASAILRLIVGLEAAQTGEIFIGDQPIRALPPHKRDIALVARDIPLLPHLTVEANLALPLQLRGMPKGDVARRVKEAASHLGLTSLLERKPPALGEADRIRVALARALAQQPRVLLLDDPLKGLKPGARRHLQAEIARLHEHFRATIVHATDDASEALTLGSQVAVLRHGALEQTGTPLDLHRDPANLFVAGLFGMSFLRGVLKASGTGVHFKESDGGIVELPLGERDVPVDGIGRDVLLGVRAEDCVVVPAERPNAQGVFQALVDFIELHEDGALYHAQTGAHALLCRAPNLPDPREAGRRVRFQIDASRVRLFDPTTTQRLV